MGEDLSNWNWSPNPDAPGGPGVSNMQGTEAYVTGTDELSPGFGAFKLPSLPPLSPIGGGGDGKKPQCGPLDFWGKLTGQCTDVPGQGTPSGGGGGKSGGCAVWDIGCRVQGTAGDILTNKSLWLIAGMILLFVVLVMVLRGSR